MYQYIIECIRVSYICHSTDMDIVGFRVAWQKNNNYDILQVECWDKNVEILNMAN